MNPSMKSYKVIIKFHNLSEYRATVKAVNAVVATESALAQHRKKTGLGENPMYAVVGSTATFAGKHLYLNDLLYSRPLNESGRLRCHCAKLLGLPESSSSVSDLQSDLLRNGVATFFRGGTNNTVCYC